MSCEFCGQAFSALVSGFIAIFLFIAIPIMQLLLALVKKFIDKIL